MNRRAFIAGLGGLAATWPLAGHAQSLFDGLLPNGRAATNTRAWQRPPSLAIVSDESDLRLKGVYEAIGFWNDELSKLGTWFRLGSVNQIVGPLPAKEYFVRAPQTLGNAPPQELSQIDSDIVVALSNDEFRSHTRHWFTLRKRRWWQYPANGRI